MLDNWDIRQEYYPPVMGTAYVVYHDDLAIGCAGTYETACDMIACIDEFGYFDPTEKRQRVYLRGRS